MTLSKRLIWPIAVIVLATLSCVSSSPASRWQAQDVPECPDSRVREIVTVKEDGGRVDWSHANNLIAFDRAGEDGFYDVYVMQPDGSNEICLTCDKQDLISQKHMGNPAWHPSGDYIVFQMEKESHPGSSNSSTPGFGLYSDLWLMSSDGEEFTRLTNTPNTRNGGVLHPHFSQDGNLLSWSEMVERPTILEKGRDFGYWKLKVADFSIGQEGPVLSNIREYEPGGPAFYENHGFSPQGDALIFSSNFGREGSVFQSSDIYVMNLTTLSVTSLTHDGYNEHAHYSPNGDKVIWMSNAADEAGGTDYWLMDSDGSNKERLTYFNHAGCPEYTGDRIIAADSSWGPDGRRLVAYIQTNLLKQTGQIVIIELEEY